jgi:tungstate transport system ATP-binding protein
MHGINISLREIQKSYNGKEVLNGCSHSFEKGCLHALIGPNGSGKSTLLRICGLVEKPDNGEVVFKQDTLEIDCTLVLRRKISLVFSKGGLFNTTVFKNTSYGLKIRGLGAKQRAAIVENILNKVGLWKKRKQNARTLSAGEGQRLAIARAFVVDPEIILIDEPTDSLDPANTVIIEDLISKMLKDKNRTIIMATHNMFQAQRLSDRVVFMHEGNMYNEGMTTEFFKNPRNEIAYRFIAGKLVY